MKLRSVLSAIPWFPLGFVVTEGYLVFRIVMVVRFQQWAELPVLLLVVAIQTLCLCASVSMEVKDRRRARDVPTEPEAIADSSAPERATPPSSDRTQSVL